MENGGILTREQLLARSRKIVTLGDGSKVVIRRLSPSDFAQIVGSMVTLSSLMGDGAANRADLNDPGISKALDAIGRTLLAAVVEPSLFPDPAQGPTPGDFTFEDQVALFSQVIDHSGYTREAAERVRP